MKLLALFLVVAAFCSCSHSTATNSSGGASDGINGTFLTGYSSTYQITINPKITLFPNGTLEANYIGRMVPITTFDTVDGLFIDTNLAARAQFQPGTLYIGAGSEAGKWMGAYPENSIEVSFSYAPDDTNYQGYTGNINWNACFDTVQGTFDCYGPDGNPWHGVRQ